MNAFDRDAENALAAQSAHLHQVKHHFQEMTKLDAEIAELLPKLSPEMRLRVEEQKESDGAELADALMASIQGGTEP